MMKSPWIVFLILAMAAFPRGKAVAQDARPPEMAPGGPADSGPAYDGLQSGLGTLPLLGRGQTHSISPENPTGGKGKGGAAVPDLTEKEWPTSGRAADDYGQGWKVRPFVRVNAGKTAVLMDVAGPGVIQHIWLVQARQVKGKWMEAPDRGAVIRFYWDDEAEPSVEAPLAEFFAIGHGRIGRVNSVPVMVNPLNALNCFWPMPFHKHARITVTNEGGEDIPLLTYQITYVTTPIPSNAGSFHAQYRQAATSTQNPYVILDGVNGRGRYVGTFLAYTQMRKGWFGEGEVKFYLDGDSQFPTICGTGTEDYFLGSFGFREPYTTAYAGTVLATSARAEPPILWSLYRWHIQDAINFDRDLKVTIQALGWNDDHSKYLKLSDYVASVAFWYQTEPHAPFPKLPRLEERLGLTRAGRGMTNPPAVSGGMR
jgi:hypothetical protein